MKKILISLLAVAFLLAGCTWAAKTPTPTEPKAIAEAFLQAFSNNDLDTGLSLLSDDIVFRQEPPGIKIEGKAKFETVLREDMAWHHQHTITIPFSVDGERVTCTAKITGDDLQIIGIEHINATYEFLIRDEKIYSILSMPNSEDWAKLAELTSGGIGIKLKFVEEGIKVEKFAENSPAYKAGVRLGDIITAVDRISYSEMREGEIIFRIKGPVGSKVLLTIIRGDMSEPIDIEVTRVDISQLHFQ